MAENRSIRLSNEVQLPMVGFGTYLISNEEAASAVSTAIGVGYRHIDTAEVYGNEQGVGQAIKASLDQDGLSREALFVTTKLWPGNAAWGGIPKTTESTIAALHNSLQHLQLDYVDLYLIHAPFQADQRLAQWRGLLELQKRGKARAIGVSNFNEGHLEEIKAAGLPMPAVNQIELHPWSQKPRLVSYLAANGVSAIAYSSLVPLSTWRATGDQESGKTDEMKADSKKEDSPFRAMARKYGVSEAQVLLRWGVQKGYPVLPKSMNAARVQKNFDLFSFALDEQDMSAIEKMDRGDGVAWSVGDPTKAS